MSTKSSEWNIAEVRRLVRDLFTYKPAIYWSDFLISVSLMWGSILIAGLTHWTSPQFFLTIFVAVFAGYRAVLFVHEIAHFKSESVPGFGLVWNLICGIPMCVPSFMYRGSHNDHHSKLIYGTKDDGEYVPFARESPQRLALYLLTPIVSPLLLPLRFAILAPASWVIPGFRKIVVTQFSSLVIDFEYVRSEPLAAERKDWRWQEPLTAAYTWLIISCLASGLIPVQFLFVWYVITFCIFTINALRTAAAHRYALPGEAVSVAEQYLDSVNITGQTFLSVLFCPVGLRYHALHHLFPTMPYHSLNEAHNRLVLELPANSPYRLASEPSIGSAIRKLWRAARAAKPEGQRDRSALMPSLLGRTRPLQLKTEERKVRATTSAAGK